jgi:2-methylcitrate dehydratase PrpD
MTRGGETNPLLAYGGWLASAPEAWLDAALAAARNAFIDTIGVAIPGAAEPVTGKVFDTVRPWGEGPCTVIGFEARLAAPWAALVNGTAAHALDFDDNFDPAKAHASAVLVPAILALAEQEDASGRACLDAYIAGLQIMGRVGQGVNPAHRNRGWHATGTVGAIGAAAACAGLLRLPEQRGGLRAIDRHQHGRRVHGAVRHRHQAGPRWPCRQGRGDGREPGPRRTRRQSGGARRPDGHEPPHGRPRPRRVARQPQPHRARQTLRFETESVGEPLLILASGLKVKRFPNCGSAHRAMDGLLALREQHVFAADDIAEVRVSAPASHLANLMYEDPRTPAQAKFSLEYALAMIALHGRCALGDFTDAAVAAPEVQAFFARVRRNPVERAKANSPPGSRSCSTMAPLTASTSKCRSAALRRRSRSGNTKPSSTSAPRASSRPTPGGLEGEFEQVA